MEGHGGELGREEGERREAVLGGLQRFGPAVSDAKGGG